jgi:hypothetical protein
MDRLFLSLGIEYGGQNIFDRRKKFGSIAGQMIKFFYIQEKKNKVWKHCWSGDRILVSKKIRNPRGRISVVASPLLSRCYVALDLAQLSAFACTVLLIQYTSLRLIQTSCHLITSYELDVNQYISVVL